MMTMNKWKDNTHQQTESFPPTLSLIAYMEPDTRTIQEIKAQADGIVKTLDQEGFRAVKVKLPQLLIRADSTLREFRIARGDLTVKKIDPTELFWYNNARYLMRETYMALSEVSTWLCLKFGPITHGTSTPDEVRDGLVNMLSDHQNNTRVLSRAFIDYLTSLSEAAVKMSKHPSNEVRCAFDSLLIQITAQFIESIDSWLMWCRNMLARVINRLDMNMEMILTQSSEKHMSS